MQEHLSRIFLLSHMRAFTSLAGHILGSNPVINGYFEMHLSYEETAALNRQYAEYARHEAVKENSRYLFDKLLHNDYRLRPERLKPASLFILVALREPASTIRSIVNLFATRQDGDAFASPESASNYYTERLEWLADFCRTADHDYHYFDAELLVKDPKRLLSALSGRLDLREPLSERYQRFSQTGKTRKGDSSRYIQSGKIDQSRSDHAHIHIPQQILDHAQAAYRNCRHQIIESAASALTL